MIREILISSLCFFSTAVFADTSIMSQYLPAISQVQAPLCTATASVSSAPDFCKTFVPAAECNCTNHKQPPSVCSSMTQIYLRMVGTYGSLPGACANQNITDQAECIADWNCYWDGGTSSKDHKPCNATGIRCTTDPRPPG
jgi:hypothetical protein